MEITLFFNVALGIHDINVSTEVRNKVVLRNALWRIESSTKNVTKGRLGSLGVALGISNLSIKSSEVWYEIVCWVT